MVLATGSLWGLWILFTSHLLLVLCTFVPSLQQFGPVVTKYSTPARTVWLTIDDGPDPQTTPQVLALLEKYGARATFFLIGTKVARYPGLAHMILEAGHSIGNHTQTHPKFSFWYLGPKGLVREIDEFESTLSSIGVPAPIWFRAPAGIKNLFLHPILPQGVCEWLHGAHGPLIRGSTILKRLSAGSSARSVREPSSYFMKRKDPMSA